MFAVRFELDKSPRLAAEFPFENFAEQVGAEVVSAAAERKEKLAAAVFKPVNSAADVRRPPALVYNHKLLAAEEFFNRKFVYPLGGVEARFDSVRVIRTDIRCLVPEAFYACGRVCVE